MWVSFLQNKTPKNVNHELVLVSLKIDKRQTELRSCSCWTEILALRAQCVSYVANQGHFGNRCLVKRTGELNLAPRPSPHQISQWQAAWWPAFVVNRRINFFIVCRLVLSFWWPFVAGGQGKQWNAQEILENRHSSGTVYAAQNGTWDQCDVHFANQVETHQNRNSEKN